MMLSKFRSLQKVERAGVVAVIRGYSQENSYKTAKACIAGGVTAIELAFTSPNTDITIKQLKISKHKYYIFIFYLLKIIIFYIFHF